MVVACYWAFIALRALLLYLFPWLGDVAHRLGMLLIGAWAVYLLYLFTYPLWH